MSGVVGHPPVGRAAPRAARAGGFSRSQRRLLAGLFLGALVVPVIFYAGPLRLSPYRLLLVIAFVPLVVGWLTGRAGRIQTVDILVLLHCIWFSLALAVNHGPGRVIEPAGIRVIETFGPYLLARVCIRDQQDFEAFARLFVTIMLVILPIALVESLFNRMLLNEMFGAVMNTFYDANRPTRWGLQRVQGPFEHPILFGVFCSAAFSLAYHVGTARRSALYRWARATPAALNTLLSLSTGAFLSLVAQIGLISWGSLMRRVKSRWRLLVVLSIAAYVIVDILSNRSPVQVFISYLTFNAGNAWNRIHIWNFGTAEVLRHPIFGIGMHDWERGWWMSPSMDNFWLVVAMRYGLPSFLLLALAILLIMRRVSRARSSAHGFGGCQSGFLFALVGICLSICTVHLWNATFAFLMFLIGSGVWMFAGGTRNAAWRRTALACTGNPSSCLRGAARGEAKAGSGSPSRRGRVCPAGWE